MDEVAREKTAAERYYASLQKAQRDYWRRKNPNPKPRGRPKKPLDENLKDGEVVQQTI
jgi:hypothetical protein